MTMRELLQQAYALAIFTAVGAAALRAQDFDKELVFYGVYHQNPWNQLIHFIFVPAIWMSFMLLHCYLPVLGLRNCVVPFTSHRVTWGTLQLAVYLTYYLRLDGGVWTRVYAVVLVALYFLACRIVHREIDRDAVQGAKRGPAAKPAETRAGLKAFHVALLLQVVSWYMQLHPGHKVFEGVKPALLDALGQSFGVAPLFAFYEGVWFAGFATNMQDEVVAKVAAERVAMCSVPSHPRFSTDYAFCQGFAGGLAILS